MARSGFVAWLDDKKACGSKTEYVQCLYVHGTLNMFKNEDLSHTLLVDGPVLFNEDWTKPPHSDFRGIFVIASCRPLNVARPKIEKYYHFFLLLFSLDFFPRRLIFSRVL